MADYKRETFPFEYVGMNLTLPIDRLPKNKARILENCRVYGSGAVRGRQGNAALANIPVGQVNSMFTLNDPVPSPIAFPGAYNTHARFAGVGTELWNSVESIGLNSYGLMESGFSGSPLSYVDTPSDFTPRPWVLIGDSAKMRKVSSAFAQHYPLGVSPPNFAPTIAIGAADANGPDIGETGTPYVYAFSGQDDAYLNTGAVGLMGPAVRDVNGLSPSSAPGASIPPSDIIVTLPQAHPDPQVTFINVWRFGGSLPQWTLIGSMPNIAGQTILDTFADLDIESNPTNDQDDNQPFLVVDSTRTGTATLTAGGGPGLGCTLTVTSGDHLRPYEGNGDDPYYLAGTTISVAGTLFTFYRSPDSTTSVELLEDPQGITGGTFVLQTPEMAHQSLPCIWGPYGGGLSGIFIFACGDPGNPGTLYWTKGNHPESHPGANTLVLTSGSETLMNGVLWGAEPYVMSTQRMFRIYPNLGGTTDFVALEVPNSKGLYARWGICSCPEGIAFVGKDGIYLSQGGAPTSLTDDDMYPLFPHEGSGSDPTSYIFVDGMNDPNPSLVGISPVDFSKPDAMRLAYGDGFLYFDYIDMDAFHRTLVYNFQSKAWVSRDTNNQSGLSCHYYEVIQDSANEALTQRQMMVGSIDGLIGTFGGSTDFGSAIGSRIRPGAYDGGDPRPRKKWGDIEIDLDTQCDTLTIQVGLDNFSYFASASTTGLNYTGRRRVTVDINSGLGQYAYNLGIDISWTNTANAIPILYFWLPTWIPEPELTALRATDFDDCGYAGAKFMQGFKLRADTLNIPRTIQVLDQDGVAHSFTPTPVLHPRETIIAYSFDVPFIAHLVRMLPIDADFWRIQGIEWIFAIAPELVQTWETQETAHDFPGWFHHRDIYLPIVSSDVVTLAVRTIENPNGPFTYTKASTAGLYDRGYFPVQPMKALAVSYRLTSPAGFRVFAKDLVVNVKAWGSSGPFMPKMPFGDTSRDPAPARI